MKAPGNIGAVIVAAGASTRLGHPKQLVEIDGKPLLVQVVESIRDSLDGPVVVVLGANEGTISEVLVGLNVPSVSNPDWKSGMGSSIAVGVRHLLEQNNDLSGILVSVCDQPFLTAKVIEGLRETGAEHPDSIVASGYADTNGPPVIFPAALFDELGKLSGRHGARHLLISHAMKVISIPFPKGEFDLDTAQDYQKFTK
jgi:molybdenum cofactor cytidylyltransferase